ncbi:MAG: hypothetical protein K0Q72_4767 [Armatimonadetes bacterium]|jgi:hypothetical protein|nr:hypothetical protein [Armatimonadota bacterium]
MSTSDDQRQILIPVTVNVAGREREIPIPVSVGLDDLVDLVVEHLNTATDIRELLVAHYAQQFFGDDAEPPSEPEPPTRLSREKPELPEFTDEEVAAVDLSGPEPPYSGRGKKSRKRLLWEAAAARSAATPEAE